MRSRTKEPHMTIVDPSKVLRGVVGDLREQRPRLTVGDIFDRAVMSVVEDGTDWRDLTTTRPNREELRHASR